MRATQRLTSLALAALVGAACFVSGQTSTPTQCSSAQACPDGQTCQIVVSTNGYCAVSGGFGAKCTTNKDCTGSYLNLPLTCILTPGAPFSVCSLSGGDAGASGGGSSNDGGSGSPYPSFGGMSSTGIARRSCDTNSDCLSQLCVDHVCTGPIIPSLNCMVNGESQCKDGTQCVLGACIPDRPEMSCSPACNIANGEVCNPYTGSCVVNPNAPPQCPGGGCGDGSRCVSSAFPGSDPFCIPTNRPCSSQAACGEEGVCVMGQCRNCDRLCNAGSDDFLAGLFGLGVNVSAITNIEDGAQLGARINGEGQLIAPPGTLMQLNGSALAALKELLFNAQQGSADAIAQIAAGAQLLVRSIQASTLGGAQILLDSGADFAVDILRITESSSLSMQLSGNGNAGNGPRRTAANFSSLNLQGPLNVAGDNSTFFIFPDRDEKCNSTSGGSVQVSGGINMQGSAGGIRINIAGSTQSGSSFSASVAIGASFSASGAILGAQATLVVSGNFSMRGKVLEPLLQIGAEGRVEFGADGGAPTMAGNVSFLVAGNGGGMATGRRQYLVISANPATGSSAGENIYFQTITNCPASATIRLNVNGTASAALAKGVVVFNYNLQTYTSVTTFLCAIEVCGLVDGVCVPVTNPNVPTVVPALSSGRRLLATTTTSSAAFNPTSLTVSSSTSNTPAGTGGNSAAHSNAQVAASGIFALVFAALFASMRM